MPRALLFLLLILIAAAAQARYAGRPLAEALRDLEQRGLRLIYSSDVITPDLIVKNEPAAGAPRQVLEQLLREHRLRAIDGPKETVVIVRDTETRNDQVWRASSPQELARDLPVTLEEIVVTPSHFGMLGSEPERRQFLSREEVRQMPHFSDDIYRAIGRVPGSAQDDISARFHLRGGEQDEVQVLLDGVQIYEPFHLKDLFSVFSTVDAEAVGSVDVLTGGFPAEYGGRMSGVVDIASLTPSERRTSIGVGILNSRLLSTGTFRGGKGQWLFSFRPGYLHQVLQLIDSNTNLDPSYYDLLGKVQVQLGDRTVVSANVLAASDRLSLDGDGDRADARSNDRYFWINARSSITPRLFARNVASIGTITRRREGSYDSLNQEGEVHDRRSFSFLTWKSDASYDLTARNVIKAGLEARRVSADYEYRGRSFAVNQIVNDGRPISLSRAGSASPRGHDFAVYAADRLRIGERLIAEAGVRVDGQSYAPDGMHVGPRLNIAWAATSRTAVRAAWGIFWQPQSVEELQVPDGVKDFYPAQKARHLVLGVDQAMGRGFRGRLEVYDKQLSNLRPRFENLFDKVSIFPEVGPDRVRIAPERGRARGAELLLRKESEGPWSGWFSYARSSVRDEIEGRQVPRSWDQRDAIGFSVNYRREKWNFNFAGTIHSGYPITSVRTFVVPIDSRTFSLHAEPGELNEDRLRGYQRFDLRASRSVRTSRGTLSAYIDVMNVFNRANVNRIDGFDITARSPDDVRVVRHDESIVPLLPSFGVSWEF
ncbi:MAG TPA: TonB-dependent receptor [Thermoanaerobaculia bacterium]|nr:TonB-dependent receptor [Thermoanaerobaculia bacterium]